MKRSAVASRGVNRGSAAVLLLVLAAIYIPLGRMVISSVNADQFSVRWEGFSTRWYRSLADGATLTRSVRNSIIIALVSSLLAVAVALAASLGRYRQQGPLVALSRALQLSRVVVPEVVLAAGLVIIITGRGWKLGFPTIVLGHVVSITAFAATIIDARLAGLDHRLVDAARDLGAGPLRMARTIIVPDLLPGVVAATLLAFVFSFDDLLLSQLLSGPTSGTLPMELLSRIERRKTPAVDAIGVLVLAGGLSAFVVSSVLLRAAAATQRASSAPASRSTIAS
jgi:ABC-type spermidine/putrescine transport system permease subunit II